MSVDSRIVTMKFDNAKFERDVKTTMSTMDKLKSNMSFSGVKTGLGALFTPLNKIGALNPFHSSQKGINDLQASASHFSLGGIEGAVTHVSGKFLALTTVALTALSTITSKAIATGGAFVKSFTFGPIMDGFHEYETNMNSIQTILANTGLEGKDGLDKVNGALNDLNRYSDKTIYNFSDMAKNIGTFTSAGVDLQTSTSAIKGIANLAAVSGSNADQASTAMYQLSQAISNNKVGLQDWNSVVNAGMGGKVFQKALYNTGQAMGTINKDGKKQSFEQWTKAGHSFRESLKDGWVTGKVLTTTLNGFTGDMTDAQLKAVGYTKEQIAGIKKMGKTGQDAAQKVKTMTQLVSTLREGMGSGWSKTWSLVFGNFNEAKGMFTGVSNVLGHMISVSANARNKMLGDWKKLGGRTVLIKAISNAFKALLAFIKPIRTAFRDIFPRTTGKQLYNFSVMLRNITKHMIIGKKTSKGLHDTFKGLFSLLSIGLMIFKGVIHYFTSLIGLLAGGSGGILDFTGALGNLITRFRDWLAKGDKVGKMFDYIINGRAALLKPIIAFISKLVSALGDIVTSGVDHALDWMKNLAPYAAAVGILVGELKGFAKTKAAEYFGLLQIYLETFEDYVSKITPKVKAWLAQFIPLVSHVHALSGSFKDLSKSGATEIADRMVAGFHNLIPMLANLGSSIKSGLRAAIAAVGSLHLNSLFDLGDSTSVAQAGIDGVQTSLHSVEGTGDRVKAAWNGVVNAFKAVGQFMAPVFEGIKNIFSGLKQKLLDFVQGMGISDGLAVVNTGFFIALYMMIRSFVKKMGGLVSAMKDTFENISGVLKQTTKNLKTMQSDVRANIILKIAAALALLAVALLILSHIPLKQLGTALGAVAALLIMLVIAMKRLEKNASFTGAAQMALLSVGLMGLAVAVLAMSAAVAVLGRMKTKTLEKGLAAVGAILVIIVAATAVLGKTGGAGQLVIAAAGILILSGALLVFAGAIKVFSMIDADTLLNGGLKIAACLAAIAVVMSLMPPNILLSAAGIVLVAGAMVLMAGVMKVFAGMSIADMAKSLIMLGGSLLILAAAMALMVEGLPGAAALLVMAAGLALLVPSLVILGNMDIKKILIALGALAGVFLVLGVAGLVLAPIVPVLIALAGAIALLGLAALAVGGGLLLFSLGLAALAASGAAGIAVLTGAIIAIAQLFPLIMQQIGLGIVAFAVVIGKAGPKLVQAFASVLGAMIDAVIRVTPKIGKALSTLLATALRVIRGYIPDMIRTGFRILMALLNGINNNIGQIIKVVGDIIVKFLDGLAKQMPRIVNSGYNLIISFMNGLTRAINKNSSKMGEAGGKLAYAIVKGMITGIASGGGAIGDAAVAAAKHALKSAMDFLHINSPSKVFRDQVGKPISEGMAAGIDALAPMVARSAVGTAQDALGSIKDTLTGIPDMLSGEIDMTPVIAPVLDLTQVQKDASTIGSLLDTNALTAGVSLDQAASISADQQASQDAASAEAAAVLPTTVEFKQYNNSPKALSSVEIYRQTKNQLSLAKEALNA